MSKSKKKVKTTKRSAGKTAKRSSVAKHKWIVISGFTPKHHAKYRAAAKRAGHKSLSSWVRAVLDKAA